MSNFGETRTALVVLGAHRSGTSVLSRALSFFGYDQPNDLVPPKPDDPKGFWESSAVVRLNDEILDMLGAKWSAPGPFLLEHGSLQEGRDEIAAAIARRWEEKAASALIHAYGGAPKIVLKDPRICLFLPLWQRACEKAGYSPKFVLVHRNPVEVAASLYARNHMGRRQAFLLWEHYNLCAVELGLTGRLDAVFAYEDILGKPKAALKSLLAQLQLPANVLSGDASASLREFVSPAERHQKFPAEAFFQTPRAADLVKETWSLLRQWSETAPDDRVKAIMRLRKTCDDSIMFTGVPIAINARKMAAIRRTIEEDTQLPLPAGPRTIILHYHVFKNAGTSIDSILEKNFGARWGAKEFETRGRRSNVEEIAAYLQARPELIALSSHNARLPLPQLEDTKVFPIVFVRHPVDRLRSAYDFERKQIADTFGANLAKAHDFAGYLRALLKQPHHRQARNFQTSRLASNEPPKAGSERERALRTLTLLPFVGLVEAYDSSIDRLEKLLKPIFPDFRAAKVHMNVAPARASSLEERLAAIEKEIGSDLLAELYAANSDDMEIYNAVKRAYAVESGN